MESRLFWLIIRVNTDVKEAMFSFQDFITTPNSSSQSNLLTYEAVSPPASTQSLNVSWNTSESTSSSATVSWNNAGTSTSWNNAGTSTSWNTLGTSSSWNTPGTSSSWKTLGTSSSWNSLGTSSVPETVSWNKLKNSTGQASATQSKLETISVNDLGSDNSLLPHQDGESCKF